ncbi:class I SAM-dependent methyltransferase [Nocardiopsis suaedae]|uniref:Class I SAM-dependent methyltransferase n=1 Tax=Nocardiopsis suaedae TaxID=3018444 RepID=A0ABT4TI58_9ACTN|nr:class I SAM-dependent methyltransferase [Nocardiopsis suaedae]MDA2804051.1 class I SAM-dependent methyltransferase [Nocardiopsis suaedae]
MSAAHQKEIGDAFGKALLDCWRGGARPGLVDEVVERDDGTVSRSDITKYFTAPADMAGPDREVLEAAHGRTLDVGCGAGRHLTALREAGVSAVGMDASPGAVEVARARGCDAVVADASRPPDGPFDTIVLLGANLGLLADADRAPGVLRALAARARPGARLFGTGLDPYHDAERHRAYHASNRRRGRMPGQVRMRVHHGDLVTDWFDYLHSSPDELAGFTAGTPWTVTGIRRDGAHYLAVLALADE